MDKKLVFQDACIDISEEKFSVSCGKLSLGFSFSSEFGFTIDSFKNKAASRDVEYIQSAQPFTPFSMEKDDAEKKDNKEEFTDVNINIVTAEESSVEYQTSGSSWNFLGADAEEILYGGVKALKLTASVSNESCKTTLNIIAFPTCSVIRYYFEIENLSSEQTTYSLYPFKMRFNIDSPRDIYRAHWFKGAHPSYDYGRKFSQAYGFCNNKKIEFSSHMTAGYVPLVVLTRDHAPDDGVMIQMDYTARWSAVIDRLNLEMLLDLKIDDDNGKVTADCGEIITTPIMAIAVFAGGLDNMMVETFDWQYKYMWDYTSNDYFAKTRDVSATHPWVYCSRILNEQFAYRLVGMDMLGMRNFMKTGQDVDWDDAGWSAFPGWPDDGYGSVFKNNYEGPDHRLSTRYYKKNGIKRLLWFAGKPSVGLLNTKHGAWGEFEWRTDGLSNWSLKDEQKFKKNITDYLDADPKRSFHTCSGGACYSITFDIQRYANFHYSADGGCGPCTNYYYTYFTLPDKWADTPQSHIGGHTYSKDCSFTPVSDVTEPFFYAKDYARSRLSMIPSLAPGVDKNVNLIREDLEIYRYFLDKGLAGKWSYMFHPGVYGDDEIFYMQRTSHDRLRACIIIRRTPEKRVIVFPAGLVADENYTVSFAMTDDTFTKTGKELMENGIVLENTPARQLIYLNLPDAPGKIQTAATPIIPRAFKLPENNVGVSGVGIYWCTDTNETNIRYYEISRNGEVIGSVAKGRYFFDYSTGWDINSVYSVRAIGDTDKATTWTNAEKVASNSSLVYSSLGDHGENFGINGWSAETSVDLKTFDAMKWTPAARFPGADFGGTPNQVGGIEGYWEGAQCAKVGRGWFQASPDAYCVKSFTVSVPGNITLTGRAVKEWYHSEYGSDIEVCVLKNSEILVPFFTLKRGDIDGLSYNKTFDVEKGDVIRFVVGKCDASNNEETHYEKNANIVGWNTIIAYNTSSSENKAFSLKINCGGNEFTDESGSVWSSDNYFANGISSSCKNVVSGKASELYTTSRTSPVGSDLKYSIPVPDGVYAVRLCFAETEFGGSCERFMKVTINGSVVERELDITHDIRTTNTAFTKVYNYVVPDENNLINITLSSTLGGSCINGIEIVSENDDIIHINCGGEDFVDWAGYVWNADSYFEGGETVYEKCLELRQASPTLYDKALYFSGRSGKDFSYCIPVQEGIYSVQLKFAEFSLTTPGARPIDVYINNYKVKDNWDALACAGEQPMSADMRFDDISSANGFINIRIVARGENPAILRAIELD